MLREYSGNVGGYALRGDVADGTILYKAYHVRDLCRLQQQAVRR